MAGGDPADPQARLAVPRELLGSVGKGTEIRPPLYCDYAYQTHVGARTFMNFGCVLLDMATIRIGDDVQVGPNVQFLTPTHPVEAEARRAKWGAAKPTSRGRPGEPAQQLAPPCRPARHSQARLAA
jgi:maltose O-acetyltransferase